MTVFSIFYGDKVPDVGTVDGGQRKTRRGWRQRVARMAAHCALRLDRLRIEIGYGKTNRAYGILGCKLNDFISNVHSYIVAIADLDRMI